MKYLFSASSLERLAEFARSRVLLAFDFDGTLAPLVSARTRAEMRPRTRALFERVCELYPCAVISGRSRTDVLERAAGAKVKHVVGNHGLEPGRNLARFERVVRRVTPELTRALVAQRGVDIEEKRYSFAVHYRKAPRRQKARTAIEAAVHGLAEPMRIIGGKLVVNVVPVGAPHKGDALTLLRKQDRVEAAMYVGDDVTDEDVFELEHRGRLLGVRVGRTKHSAGEYYLRDQREIDRLLRILIELRD